MSKQQVGVEWFLRLTLLMLFSRSAILLSSCLLSVRVALWETWKNINREASTKNTPSNHQN